jgi:hypothetical protein
MTVQADVARILLERIEASHPAPALFSPVETDEWPAKCLSVLVKCGLLKSGGRAESLWCPGCEWQCHKTVVVRTAGAHLRNQAFVTCDEEPGHGRISVPLRSLEQYAATLSGVSGFIAGQMALGPPRSLVAGTWCHLGTIKGRHGPRPLSVGFDAGRLVLRVGRQQESIAQVMNWIGDRLSIDRAHIRRLANRKGAVTQSGVQRAPDFTLRQERARRTRARYDAIFREAKKRHANRQGNWTAIAAAIAATDLAKAGQGRRLSPATIRRIVTQMRRRER